MSPIKLRSIYKSSPTRAAASFDFLEHLPAAQAHLAVFWQSSCAIPLHGMHAAALAQTFDPAAPAAQTPSEPLACSQLKPVMSEEISAHLTVVSTTQESLDLDQWKRTRSGTGRRRPKSRRTTQASCARKWPFTTQQIEPKPRPRRVGGL